MVPRQTHVLIHVERDHILKADLALVVQLDETLVRHQWRRARRASQHEWTIRQRSVRVDPVRNILGRLTRLGQLAVLPPFFFIFIFFLFSRQNEVRGYTHILANGGSVFSDDVSHG